MSQNKHNYSCDKIFKPSVQLLHQTCASADAIFSTFTGLNALMLLLQGARVYFRRCSFRDFDLAQEIFDVSFGSAVRLENCTFTNITVPNNDYVSTSGNDGEVIIGESFEIMYYPEDDAGPLFDVLRHRANGSIIFEEGVSASVMRAR
jgi:hypothetical protein